MNGPRNNIATFLADPWHSQGTMPRWLFGLLAVFAVFNLARLAGAPALIESGLTDLVNVYVGQELTGAAKNPYDTRTEQEFWDSLHTDLGIPVANDYEPGLPTNPVLYPPWALAEFRILHCIPFAAERFLWFGVLCASIAGIGFFTRRLGEAGRPWWPATCLETFLIILAFKGTIQCTLVGQPFLFFCCLIVAGLSAGKRDRPVLSGILIGLGMGKVTLGIPVILMLVLTRQWKTLLASAAVVLALVVAFFAMVSHPVVAVQSFFADITAFKTMLFGPENGSFPFYPGSRDYGAVALTELGVIIRMLDAHATAYTSIVYGCVWIASGAIFAVLRRPFVSQPLLGMAYWGCTLALTFYTQYYDFLFGALLLFLVARRVGPRTVSVFCIVNLLMFVPLNGLLHFLPDSPLVRIAYVWLPPAVLVNWLFAIHIAQRSLRESGQPARSAAISGRFLS